MLEQAQGGEVHAVVADVGKHADNKRIVDETLEKYGRLDVSFINAGVGRVSTFSKVMSTFETLVFDVMGRMHMLLCYELHEDV
jgi:NAD(P)-dependent dehydrogenase (short-subunit alcohol dehydrogenase family)